MGPLVGRGVIAIERLPRDGSADGFNWAGILRRKAEIAREIDADWFIHQDADEFRESPWPDVTLKHAIERVDRAGYNAIDFLSLDFWPVGEDWQGGTDVRQAFRCLLRGLPGRSAADPLLEARRSVRRPRNAAGTRPIFKGRHVFPIRFLSRHYPIRGQAHGERKVFRDRQPRFLPQELARGWHVQYAGQVRTTAWCATPPP